MSESKIAFAVQDSFPNQSQTAEKEFIQRLQICVNRLSLKMSVIINSTQAIDSTADFVLSLHEVSPKLTPKPTIGTMWNPPGGIQNDPIRCAFVSSFDGYLSASANVKAFIKEQVNKFGDNPKPIADFEFYPSSPCNIAHAKEYGSLVYLGVHWDGNRHAHLIDSLAQDGLVSLYGPENAWRHAGDSYRGTIPFDGVSVIRTLASHGIVLCIHRSQHVTENTPSMRLFEAASARCLIISDDIPFAREMFGNSIFILPEGNGRDQFIREIVAWAKANPKRAREMACESNRIFELKCSLDVLLPKVLQFGNTISRNMSRRKTIFRLPAREWIDILYLGDTHDEDAFDLALETINSQTHRYIRFIIAGGERLEVKHSRVRPRMGVKLDIIDAKPDSIFSEKFFFDRSISSDYIGAITSKVEWAPNHLTTLFATLRAQPNAEMAQSRSVYIAREGVYINAPNFSGDLGLPIRETRILSNVAGENGFSSLQSISVLNTLSKADCLLTKHALVMMLNKRESHLNVLRTGDVTAFIRDVDETAMGLVSFS